METFRSYAYMDTFDRLNVVSSTQVPFHIRRMVANALELPKSQIKVIKPRIGGGFGAKQTRLYRNLYSLCDMEAEEAVQACVYQRGKPLWRATPAMK